jgi:hypothetical protein
VAFTPEGGTLLVTTINLAAELAGTGVTVNAYRPGSVDTATQAWIRDQDPDAIGPALYDRFTERHAAGDLITPEASAAALIRRLDGDARRDLGRRGRHLEPIGEHPGDHYRGRHRPHQVCAGARGRGAGDMSGALVKREQRALCRISEAACVRPGR